MVQKIHHRGVIWVPNSQPQVGHSSERKWRLSSQYEDCPWISIGNLIFFLGKTTTILAAARDLFGDIWRSRILELNASDERGIAVVRDKIKGFSQQSVSNSGSKVPPFKIIILDEADRFVYFFYLGDIHVLCRLGREGESNQI